MAFLDEKLVPQRTAGTFARSDARKGLEHIATYAKSYGDADNESR
jgi:hypothetical protein